MESNLRYEDNNLNNEKRTDSNAVVAFVISIMSLAFCGFLGIISIALGITSKRKIKSVDNLDGEGLASVAITFGIIGLVFWGIIFGIYIISILLIIFGV